MHESTVVFGWNIQVQILVDNKEDKPVDETFLFLAKNSRICICKYIFSWEKQAN